MEKSSGTIIRWNCLIKFRYLMNSPALWRDFFCFYLWKGMIFISFRYLQKWLLKSLESIGTILGFYVFLYYF